MLSNQNTLSRSKIDQNAASIKSAVKLLIIPNPDERKILEANVAGDNITDNNKGAQGMHISYASDEREHQYEDTSYMQ
jgi:hypothetical protein